MKTVRKTFITLFVTAFSVVFALLCTVLIAAACSERVTLRFETGDGTYLASVEGPSGGTYEKPHDPEKTGYFFDGWYANAECTGESLSLPDRLPDVSTTYYAKYIRCPVLSLDAEGGSLDETEHHIRPGTDLLGYLSDYIPHKDGLVFGGWENRGELLSDGAKMTEEDMYLSARYKAEYEVQVFLQAADEPQKFEKNEELSYKGADWLGARFTAQPPALSHFLFDTETSLFSADLHEGENQFLLRYTREALRVHYRTELPDGGTEEGTIESRYGAHVALSDPYCPEGYTFFGWSDGENEYGGGSILLLERSLDLKGSWGKLYPNLRGEGSLAVEVGEESVRRADYMLGGNRIKGTFNAEDGTFVAGSFRGRLAKGGFLPDDSGRYLGESLAENATGEQYGVLTLDFDRGVADFRFAQSDIRGEYQYDYDEAAQKYTGDYIFSSEELDFRFRLGENTFLRQGDEKDSYAAYDLIAGEFLPDTLTLDGYGGGLWKQGEIPVAGSYRGGSVSGEWEFLPENGERFRILLGKRVWADEEDFAGEQAFLYYDGSLAGEFRSSAGTLSLDGYGLKAVYRSSDREISGPFTRTGNVIAVQADPPLRFTLTGSGFSPTGEECGTYSGKNGTLFLDGAGGATLTKGSLTLADGTYRKEGEDWLFLGETDFRFRLSGDRYLVFDEALFGQFNAEWGLALELDGYGGAVYHNIYGGVTSLTVAFADEGLLLLSSEELLTNYRILSLALDRSGMRVTENPSMSAGIFAVESENAFLVLDGNGGAIYAGERKLYGTYEMTDRTDLSCVFDSETAAFRIGETENGYSCRKAITSGQFQSGRSELILDGYGTARYLDESDGFVAPYVMRGGYAEVERTNELWRFALEENTFALTRYAKYTAPGGESALYLQKGGKNAILRAEKDYLGMYSEEQLFLSPEKEFAYRLYGGEYRVYKKALAVTYSVEGGGGTLSLDGCGLGVFAVQGKSYSGEVTITDVGLVVFSCSELPALSGMAGFKLGGNGTLIKLGDEFGLYTPSSGGELFLQGDGTAYYRKNGVWRVGSYESVAPEEYCFDLHGESFRFRVEKTATGSGYTVYSEALAAYSGEYRTQQGTLVVDGYGITLGQKKYRFVCGGKSGFVALEEGTQNYFAVHIGENTTLQAAKSRYLA